MDFSNYKFRCHSVGKIMGGVPKPLTSEQEKTYNSLILKHKSNNKNLTFSQMKRYSFLIGKHKSLETELTENQKSELFDLILKYESKGKNLTLNQIETLGDLHRKKKSKLKLDDSAKKECERIVWMELTGRSKDAQGRMLDKGIMKEEESITLYSKVAGKLFTKNKERLTNDFLNGECDNSQNKTIRDIKTSWEYNSFPLRSLEINNPVYEWQLDGYMDLWTFKKSELIHTLVDTPFNLIDDELRSLDWKCNVMDSEGNIREKCIDLVVETVSNHIYTIKGLKEYCDQSFNVHLEWFEGKFKEIPEEIRIKIFEHKYSSERNTQMKQMILLARGYMNLILEDLGGDIMKFNEMKLSHDNN